jgi:hypothetical protein
MAREVKILIQTTTQARPDDWSVDSLSLLREHLASLDEVGTRFEVTARNREAPPGTKEPMRLTSTSCGSLRWTAETA